MKIYIEENNEKKMAKSMKAMKISVIGVINLSKMTYERRKYRRRRNSIVYQRK